MADAVANPPAEETREQKEARKRSTLVNAYIAKAQEKGVPVKLGLRIGEENPAEVWIDFADVNEYSQPAVRAAFNKEQYKAAVEAFNERSKQIVVRIGRAGW